MSDQRFEYRASLQITSSVITPEQVTALLGQPPDSTWKAGDPITENPGSGRRRNHGWKLRAPRAGVDDCECQTTELALLISPLADKLKLLPAECAVEIAVSAITHEARPFIFVRPQAMRVFAEVGASLNCDIYDLSSVDNENV